MNLPSLQEHLLPDHDDNFIALHQAMKLKPSKVRISPLRTLIKFVTLQPVVKVIINAWKVSRLTLTMGYRNRDNRDIFGCTRNLLLAGIHGTGISTFISEVILPGIFQLRENKTIVVIKDGRFKGPALSVGQLGWKSYAHALSRFCKISINVVEATLSEYTTVGIKLDSSKRNLIVISIDAMLLKDRSVTVARVLGDMKQTLAPDTVIFENMDRYIPEELLPENNFSRNLITTVKSLSETTLPETYEFSDVMYFGNVIPSDKKHIAYEDIRVIKENNRNGEYQVLRLRETAVS